MFKMWEEEKKSVRKRIKNIRILFFKRRRNDEVKSGFLLLLNNNLGVFRSPMILRSQYDFPVSFDCQTSLRRLCHRRHVCAAPAAPPPCALCTAGAVRAAASDTVAPGT
jgi:hypothetical protein